MLRDNNYYKKNRDYIRKCRKIAFFIIVVISIDKICLAQDEDEMLKKYDNCTTKADSLYKLKEYSKATVFYSAAFEAKGGQGKVRDRYKAACCWALLNNKDSAFFQLYRIVVKGKYVNLDECLNETSFVSLHNDKRWEPLIAIIKKNALESLE